jgi:hypothetical protein
MSNQNRLPDTVAEDASVSAAGSTPATVAFLKELPKHTQPFDEKTEWEKDFPIE